MLGNWDLKNEVYYSLFFKKKIIHLLLLLLFLSFWFLFLINVFMFFTESILKKEEEAFETFEGIMESCNLLIVSWCLSMIFANYNLRFQCF